MKYLLFVLALSLSACSSSPAKPVKYLCMTANGTLATDTEDPSVSLKDGWLVYNSPDAIAKVSLTQCVIVEGK